MLNKEKVPKMVGHDIYLLPEYRNLLRSFEAFYKGKFSQRNLEWNMIYSTASVSVNLPSGKYLIKCNMVQASLLVLLNRGVLLYEEVEKYFETIDPKELNTIFSPLLRIELVIKNSGSFVVNKEFASHKKLYKLPVWEKEEEVIARDKVEKEREIAVDCLIVRTMKKHKLLEHQQLLNEVFEQLERFKVGSNVVF